MAAQAVRTKGDYFLIENEGQRLALRKALDKLVDARP